MMNPLSPVDAISPAFSRARTILTPPGSAEGEATSFRFWFFLKIAVAAALTQGNVYGFFVAIGVEGTVIAVAIAAGVLHRTGAPLASPGGLGAPALAAVALTLGFVFIIGIVFVWLWCRLRFALFDLVVYRHGLVSRAWAPYAAQAWRFLGLMILIGLALTLILALTAGPFLLHLVLTLRHLTPRQINSDPTFFFTHIFPMYGIFFAVVIVASLVNAIAQDFLLPPLALEDAPLGSSFSRFFHLLRTRFWYVALYLLLRIVLALGLAWVGMMAVFLVAAVFGAGGFGVGFLLYHAFWHAGPGGPALFILYCVLAGLLLLALYFLGMLLVYGVVAVVMQSYAVWFYGSYYPPLGDRLEPPPTPSATPSPLPLPPLSDPPLAP